MEGIIQICQHFLDYFIACSIVSSVITVNVPDFDDTKNITFFWVRIWIYSRDVLFSQQLYHRECYILKSISLECKNIA